MEAQHSNEDFAVGCILSIKTSLGEEFQGQVLTFDWPSNILVLQEGINSGSSTKRNIRLLKANYIKEFTFLGQSEDPLDVSKCFIDLNNLQAKEDSAIRQAELEAERFGVGVTAEAQSIFDALSKTVTYIFTLQLIMVVEETVSLGFRVYTKLQIPHLLWRYLVEKDFPGLPVRWDKTVIVVMNEVQVSSPYLPESVIGGTPAANERVRKVLEFERKRLQTRHPGQ